jgi:hypothetical protein
LDRRIALGKLRDIAVNLRHEISNEMRDNDSNYKTTAEAEDFLKEKIKQFSESISKSTRHAPVHIHKSGLGYLLNHLLKTLTKGLPTKLQIKHTLTSAEKKIVSAEKQIKKGLKL